MKIINRLNIICKWTFLFSILCIFFNLPTLGFLLAHSVNAATINQSDGSSGDLGLDISPSPIDIVSAPRLPDIIQLPLIRDEFVGKIGFAYKGSNPSFEIKTNSSILTSEIISVDLIDRSQAIFTNIPFTVFAITGSQDTLVLGLTLPDNLSLGEARFILHVKNSEPLTGTIHILSFLNIKTLQAIRTGRVISEPVIERLKQNTTSHKMKLQLIGKDFIGREVLFEEGGITRALQNPPNNPNTFVTIYPSNLNLSLKRSSVSANRKIMKIEYVSSSPLVKTSAVLVITTPRGIVSKEFTITPRVRKH